MSDSHSTPPTPSLLKRVVWLLVVVAATYAAWHWGEPVIDSMAKKAGEQKRPAPGPTPVTVAQAARGEFEEWASVSGTVTPLNYVTVRSRVDGELMKLHFQEGQDVKEGDLLAEIDPRTFQVALEQARSQKLRNEALLENARADFRRYRTLLEQDSIAKQQVDTQESLVRQYEADIESDTSAVASADLQLSYTRITAPLTGRAGLRQVDPGNLIRSSDANGLVTITQMDPIGLIFSVPQELVPTVRAQMNRGEEVPVEAVASNQKTVLARGKLLTTDNQIDLASGTLRMKAEVPNSKSTLFPNQFVTVRLLVNRVHNAVTVPATAVQQGSKGPFLYVAKPDGTATLRQLKTGPTHQEKTLIEQGVEEGEAVITEGVDRLREGSKIRVIEPDSEGEAKNGGHGQRHQAVNEPATSAPARR